MNAMLPRWKDVTDLVDVFRYNLGLSPAARSLADSIMRKSWSTGHSSGEPFS